MTYSHTLNGRVSLRTMENKKRKLSKWKSKNIYWHKVIFIDLNRIKKDKLMQRPYRLGQIVGFANIEKYYQTFDEKSKDITPYIVFKYLGKTLYSDNYKQRQENFKEFQKQLKSKEVKQEAMQTKARHSSQA